MPVGKTTKGMEYSRKLSTSVLLRELAEKSDLTYKKAHKIGVLFLQIIGEHLANGEEMELFGIGTFRTKRMAKKTMMNHYMHRRYEIPAYATLSFRFSQPMKRKIRTALTARLEAQDEIEEKYGKEHD